MNEPGSTKANGKEPETCLGQVFNFKLDCFNHVRVLIYADTHPHLQLKTRPSISPISLSLSINEPNRLVRLLLQNIKRNNPKMCCHLFAVKHSH